MFMSVMSFSQCPQETVNFFFTSEERFVTFKKLFLFSFFSSSFRSPGYSIPVDISMLDHAIVGDNNAPIFKLTSGK